MTSLTVWCPTKTFTFPYHAIRSSPYIKGTLLEKTFFDTRFKTSNTIFFNFSEQIIESILIPLIRSGIIYNPFKEKDLVLLAERMAFLHELSYTDESVPGHAYNLIKYGYLDGLVVESINYMFNAEVDMTKQPAIPNYYEPYIDDVVKLVVDSGIVYPFFSFEDTPWKIDPPVAVKFADKTERRSYRILNITEEDAFRYIKQNALKDINSFFLLVKTRLPTQYDAYIKDNL
jgi:hypothetical protein